MTTGVETPLRRSESHWRCSRKLLLPVCCPPACLPVCDARTTAVTGLPQELAAEVLALALGTPAPGWRLAGAVTAAELLQKQQQQVQPGSSASSSCSGSSMLQGISTGCAGLNALLGGAGVACGSVTEFCECCEGAGSCVLGTVWQLERERAPPELPTRLISPPLCPPPLCCADGVPGVGKTQIG
jgi:hypothetical protein